VFISEAHRGDSWGEGGTINGFSVERVLSFIGGEKPRGGC